MPHLNFGILSWGTETSRIALLQKRSVRNISNDNYLAHTEPILISLNILKIEDVYKLKLFKLHYHLMNNRFPSYFKKFKGLLELTNTGYDLRPKPLQTPLIALTFAEKNSSFKLIRFLQTFPDNILSKVETHGLHYLSKQIKSHFIDNYNTECVDPNCYVCNQI